MNTYIHATQEAGKEFYQRFHNKGKVVMLNLLKFRSVADYTVAESLKPAEEISGVAAYKLYMQEALPMLKEAGNRVLYYGKSHGFLIGPDSEKWDAILLVEHASVHSFMVFAQNESYLKIAGHRTAALQDARLLPSNKVPF